MGLFGPKEPLDSHVAGLWIRPQQHNLIREMEKELIKSQATILQNSNSQTNPLTAVAVGWRASTGRHGVLAITANKVIRIDRSRVETVLEVRDIAEVKLGTSGDGTGVTIYTRTALLDFQPDDPRKFHHAIIMIFPSPRVALGVDNELRALVPSLREES